MDRQQKVFGGKKKFLITPYRSIQTEHCSVCGGYLTKGTVRYKIKGKVICVDCYENKDE